MDDNNSVDTITPTIIGLWVGVIGTAVGLAGFGFSVYTFVEKEPNIRLLILSGWGAAALASVTAGIIAYRLVKLISGMSQKIAALSSEVGTLRADYRELQADNRRLIEIDAYILTSAQKRAKPRVVSAVQANPPEQAPGG